MQSLAFCYPHGRESSVLRGSCLIPLLRSAGRGPADPSVPPPVAWHFILFCNWHSSAVPSTGQAPRRTGAGSLLPGAGASCYLVQRVGGPLRSVPPNCLPVLSAADWSCPLRQASGPLSVFSLSRPVRKAAPRACACGPAALSTAGAASAVALSFASFSVELWVSLVLTVRLLRILDTSSPSLHVLHTVGSLQVCVVVLCSVEMVPPT